MALLINGIEWKLNERGKLFKRVCGQWLLSTCDEARQTYDKRAKSADKYFEFVKKYQGVPMSAIVRGVGGNEDETRWHIAQLVKQGRIVAEKRNSRRNGVYVRYWVAA